MNPPGEPFNPQKRIAALLRSLYGERAGAQTTRGVGALIDQYSAALKVVPGGGIPCERGALLITYADQVRKAGIAPLRTLAPFCEKPIYFGIEQDSPHRMLEYTGRTTPRIKKGKLWKYLDAETVFDWK